MSYIIDEAKSLYFEVKMIAINSVSGNVYEIISKDIGFEKYWKEWESSAAMRTLVYYPGNSHLNLNRCYRIYNCKNDLIKNYNRYLLEISYMDDVDIKDCKLISVIKRELQINKLIY